MDLFFSFFSPSLYYSIHRQSSQIRLFRQSRHFLCGRSGCLGKQRELNPAAGRDKRHCGRVQRRVAIAYVRLPHRGPKAVLHQGRRQIHLRQARAAERHVCQDQAGHHHCALPRGRPGRRSRHCCRENGRLPHCQRLLNIFHVT